MTHALLAQLRQDDTSLLVYLDQLERYWAEMEPRIRAFVPLAEGENVVYWAQDVAARFDRLRQEAKALLAAYPDPDTRPCLFGLPLGVKDIFHVDGWPTQAGSQLPPERLSGAESAVVTALRRAGALVMGKTVTTEFAYFAPGPTRNPHNLAHTPGGSSSGSAAAVAAQLCAVALGTQTIGSVNRPAAFCGVVGFKPTHGRVSTAGVIPVSQTWDHVGFFTRHPADLELIMPVVCADWAGGEIEIEKQESVETPRPVLGLPVGPYLDHADEIGRAHLEKLIATLVEQGYLVKRVPVMPDFADLHQKHLLVMAGEMARVHAEWFAEYRELYRPETAALIEQGQRYSDEQISQAAHSQTELAERLQRQMVEAGIDFWLAPSAPGIAPHGLDSTGNPIMNLPWTHAGMPTLTLPTGTDPATGLPLGTQFVARRGGDEALLAWATPELGVNLH